MPRGQCRSSWTCRAARASSNDTLAGAAPRVTTIWTAYASSSQAARCPSNSCGNSDLWRTSARGRQRLPAVCRARGLAMHGSAAAPEDARTARSGTPMSCCTRSLPRRRATCRCHRRFTSSAIHAAWPPRPRQLHHRAVGRHTTVCGAGTLRVGTDDVGLTSPRVSPRAGSLCVLDPYREEPSPLLIAGPAVARLASRP